MNYIRYLMDNQRRGELGIPPPRSNMIHIDYNGFRLSYTSNGMCPVLQFQPTSPSVLVYLIQCCSSSLSSASVPVYLIQCSSSSLLYLVLQFQSIISTSVPVYLIQCSSPEDFSCNLFLFLTFVIDYS